MNPKIKKINNKILTLIEELKKYSNYKKILLTKLNQIFKEYQNKKYTYEQYQKKVQTILKGKTKEEKIEEFNSIIYTILKKIEVLNQILFYETYKELKSIHKPETANKQPAQQKTILEKEIETVEETKQQNNK